MFEMITNGSVTDPKGFKAAGIHANIKKKKKDMALIFSDYPCSAAGTFTLNKVKAAPILLSQYLINQKSKVRAILINSGNANACTGQQGYNDALETQSYLAQKTGINQSEVLVSSTGVIGEKLPMDKMLAGIDSVIPQLSYTGGIDAAEAIMTTDITMKNFGAKVKLSGGEVTIGCICKGSGMIMPNMATMLAFVTTDAIIEQYLLQRMLSESVNLSFNRISVDGETSTNDMVILLANGASGIKLEEQNSDYLAFKNALDHLCILMAKSVASDGEGASKLVTVNVKSAKNLHQANLAAKAICNSPLVKTAVYGNDANWGRIISAVGNSGIEFDPDKVSVKFGDMDILQPNYQSGFDEEEAKKKLDSKEVTITVDLDYGDADTTWWTCDFTEGYIKINASYRS